MAWKSYTNICWMNEVSPCTDMFNCFDCWPCTCWAAAEWFRETKTSMPILLFFYAYTVCMLVWTVAWMDGWIDGYIQICSISNVLKPAPGNNYTLYENECKIIINRKQTRTDGKSILKTLFLFVELQIDERGQQKMKRINWEREAKEYSHSSQWI